MLILRSGAVGMVLHRYGEVFYLYERSVEFFVGNDKNKYD